LDQKKKKESLSTLFNYQLLFSALVVTVQSHSFVLINGNIVEIILHLCQIVWNERIKPYTRTLFVYKQ